VKCDLGISLDGPDLVAIGHAILKSPWMEAFQHPPDSMMLNGEEAEVDEQWLSRFLAPSTYGTSVNWRPPHGSGAPARFCALTWGLVLKFNVDAIDSDEALPIMAEWPFDVATISSLHDSWYSPMLENRYRAPSFGNGHDNLGWACLLRGEEGHRRLVSRRWLDFGPWRVLRGPNDTTMVQFHDVHADALTALEQAKLGHQMMANTKHGCIINPLFRIRNKFSGFHSQEPPHVRIICHAGRKVTPSEMRRLHGALSQQHLPRALRGTSRWASSCIRTSRLRALRWPRRFRGIHLYHRGGCPRSLA